MPLFTEGVDAEYKGYLQHDKLVCKQSWCRGNPGKNLLGYVSNQRYPPAHGVMLYKPRRNHLVMSQEEDDFFMDADNRWSPSSSCDREHWSNRHRRSPHTAKNHSFQFKPIPPIRQRGCSPFKTLASPVVEFGRCWTGSSHPQLRAGLRRSNNNNNQSRESATARMMHSCHHPVSAGDQTATTSSPAKTRGCREE